MTPLLVECLAVALERTGRLVGGVREEQWSDPTPCIEWTVRQLVDHLVVGNLLFAGVVTGRPQPVPDVVKAYRSGPLADRPVEAYRTSAEAVAAAFRCPGALDGQYVVPLGPVSGIVAAHLRITEAVVHGWDLARATGQRTDFPADLVEQELAFSLAALPDVPPDRAPFGPATPVADDAPAIDRLAACLGRPVDTWRGERR